VTAVPGGPEDGLIVTAGLGTLSGLAEVYVSPPVVSVSWPVAAPSGTTEMISVAELTRQVAPTDPKLSVHGAVKPVPDRYTLVLTLAVGGVNPPHSASSAWFQAFA
jgi:hypothetical protein